MGELGRGLVRVDRDALLADLVRAYADEWCAHYNFQLVANTLRGHRSPSVLDFLRRRTAEALSRANRLAARVVELGGRLPTKVPELVERASDKPFKLPDSMGDVDGVLKAVLDAERTSLRTYAALHERTRAGDVVTETLAAEFLTATVRNEEEIERLIGDSAPTMTGA
jgi:ferritin-like protein